MWENSLTICSLKAPTKKLLTPVIFLNPLFIEDNNLTIGSVVELQWIYDQNNHNTSFKTPVHFISSSIVPINSVGVYDTFLDTLDLNSAVAVKVVSIVYLKNDSLKTFMMEQKTLLKLPKVEMPVCSTISYTMTSCSDSTNVNTIFPPSTVLGYISTQYNLLPLTQGYVLPLIIYGKQVVVYLDSLTSIVPDQATIFSVHENSSHHQDIQQMYAETCFPSQDDSSVRDPLNDPLNDELMYTFRDGEDGSLFHFSSHVYFSINYQHTSLALTPPIDILPSLPYAPFNYFVKSGRISVPDQLSLNIANIHTNSKDFDVNDVSYKKPSHHSIRGGISQVSSHIYGSVQKWWSINSVRNLQLSSNHEFLDSNGNQNNQSCVGDVGHVGDGNGDSNSESENGNPFGLFCLDLITDDFSLSDHLLSALFPFVLNDANNKNKQLHVSQEDLNKLGDVRVISFDLSELLICVNVEHLLLQWTAQIIDSANSHSHSHFNTHTHSHTHPLLIIIKNSNIGFAFEDEVVSPNQFTVPLSHWLVVLSRFARLHSPLFLLFCKHSLSSPLSWTNALSEASHTHCILTQPSLGEMEMDTFNSMYDLYSDHLNIVNAVYVSKQELLSSGVGVGGSIGLSELACRELFSVMVSVYRNCTDSSKNSSKSNSESDPNSLLPIVDRYSLIIRQLSQWRLNQIDIYNILPISFQIMFNELCSISCSESVDVGTHNHYNGLYSLSSQILLLNQCVVGGSIHVYTLFLKKIALFLRFPGLISKCLIISKNMLGLSYRLGKEVFLRCRSKMECLSIFTLLHTIYEVRKTLLSTTCPWLFDNQVKISQDRKFNLDFSNLTEKTHNGNTWCNYVLTWEDLFDLGSKSLISDHDVSGDGITRSNVSVGGNNDVWESICGYNSIVNDLKNLSTQWGRSIIKTSFINNNTSSNSNETSFSSHSAGQTMITTGIILSGPAGTGKSLISQTISRHTGLPTLLIGCSDIYQKYMGESESKIREIFATARNMSPCVLIMEDLDVIAPNRNKLSTGGSNTGVELRVLSTLLNELDGIEGRENVFVVGICRDKSDIDAALIRPGRFDQVYNLDLPTSDDIRALLEFYLGDVAKKSNNMLDLDRWSSRCTGMNVTSIIKLCMTTVEVKYKSFVNECRFLEKVCDIDNMIVSNRDVEAVFHTFKNNK